MERANRIVLAVRVGRPSRAAGRTAAWLAERLGAELTLVYVATELRTVPEVATGTAMAPDAVQKRIVQDVSERARRWGRETLGDVPFDVRIEDGSVPERITAVAGELNAALIVAGSEGRGAIEGIIMGDTTRAILKRSPCPVVVVPPLAQVD